MKKLPLHSIGIIPDGNRRWANQHAEPYLLAYQKSMRVLGMAIEYIFSSQPGVENIVIYMMSKRNLQRSRDDLSAVILAETTFCDDLMPNLARALSFKVVPVGLSTLRSALVRNLDDTIVKNYIKAFHGIGNLTKLHKTNKTVYLLAGYDPFDELNRVIKQGAKSISIKKLLVPVEIDLVIRTANEYRLSDFAPLQCGYAEFVFIDKYFQDLSTDDIDRAISIYQKRNRTIGS